MATLDHFGRFAGPAQQVLHTLTSGPRVPVAIRRDVSIRCGRDLGPGTLFGTLARLERHALIEVIESRAAPRAYRLTALGAETLEAQLASVMQRAPSSAPAANLSPVR